MRLAKVAFVCFLIVLAKPFLSATAQSGRVAPPEPTPSSLPRTSPKPPADSLVLDPRAPKYKLVFGDDEFGGFVKRLNQDGEQGYKLKSAVYGLQKSNRKNYFARPVALLQLDEAKYEYAWFETTSHWFFGVDGFDAKYAEMAKQGFRLVDHFRAGGSCEEARDCEVFHVFLLERLKGVAEPGQFRVAGSSPGRRMKLDLSSEINEGVAVGFYPVDLISKFQILLEPVEKEDLPVERPDVQWTNLESKMKSLAKQGYQLAFVYDEAIVMYRYPGSNTPLQYVWFTARKGDLEKRLKELEPSGATYRTVYRDDHWSGGKLVFEQKITSDGSRHEFRVLRFEFQLVEDASGRHVQIDLTPAGKEALKNFNELVAQGFVVRSLFGSDHVAVLLER